MVYGFCGSSLRQTAAWAQMAGVANVSDVALLKRFRASADWMCGLVSMFLASRVSPPAHLGKFSRIRLVDGTTVSKPGSSGSDWRIHLGFDLVEQSIISIDLTDSSAGESLTRITPAPGELIIADRGYARTRGVEAVVKQGGHILVRVPWNNVPMRSPHGSPFDLHQWLRGAPEAAPTEVEVRVGSSSTPFRLLALRKSEPAAEASRTRVLARATNHTKTTDPRTLEAAGFTLLLTDVPAADLGAEAAFDLYRYRWQIELCFKTLKSVISLDQLSAKDPQLARMTLAAKLLGALLINEFTDRYESFSPWGYPIRPESTRISLASG
jgi:hypothetical protein